MSRRANHIEDGSVAVEMALVLPVLVLLLGGIVDFGFAFNAQISLTQAAREGVRVEAIERDSAAATAAAEAAFVAPAVSSGSASVTSACPASGGGQARLTISATYTGFFLPFNPALEGQAVMRCGG